MLTSMRFMKFITDNHSFKLQLLQTVCHKMFETAQKNQPTKTKMGNQAYVQTRCSPSSCPRRVIAWPSRCRWGSRRDRLPAGWMRTCRHTHSRRPTRNTGRCWRCCHRWRCNPQQQATEAMAPKPPSKAGLKHQCFKPLHSSAANIWMFPKFWNKKSKYKAVTFHRAVCMKRNSKIWTNCSHLLFFGEGFRKVGNATVQ